MAYANEAWTLDQLHRLPTDGNHYELLGGELLVTPPPSPSHKLLASRLRSLCDDTLTKTELLWHPAGATEPLVIDVEGFFHDALR